MWYNEFIHDLVTWLFWNGVAQNKIQYNGEAVFSKIIGYSNNIID